jgi:putative hydrolase of the HAD superfamily
MHRMKCVFLDLGKVLVDFDLAHFSERVCELAGVKVEVLREAVAGDGLAQRYESGLITDAEFHDSVCKRIGARIDMEDFVQAWNSIFLPVPILDEALIQSLSERAVLWVISNTNKIHFDFVLSRFSLLRHFKGFVLSHEVRAMKPEPKIFQIALERAGVAQSQSVFVDDQLPNVLAARDLGIDAFQFLNPGQFTVELRERNLL